MRSTIRCGDCSMYLTLLVSPDSAGRCLGCARVVSLPGVLSFWSKYPNFYSYVQINRILIWNLVRQRWKVARTLREYEVGSSIPGALSFFFFWCSVFFHLFFLGTVWGFTTGYPDLIDDYTAVRCCTTYEYVFATAAVLLLFVIVCRVTKFISVVVASDSIFSFSYSKTMYFQCTPWQYCRMYSLDLPIR